ncbi:MAG: hypothetical protein AAGN15_03780 [Cyanobacteria bacterium J06581_3]
MSNFFQQLITRHQGEADIVMPLVPSPFETLNTPFDSAAFSTDDASTATDRATDTFARPKPVVPPTQPSIHRTPDNFSTPQPSSTATEGSIAIPSVPPVALPPTPQPSPASVVSAPASSRPPTPSTQPSQSITNTTSPANERLETITQWIEKTVPQSMSPPTTSISAGKSSPAPVLQSSALRSPPKDVTIPPPSRPIAEHSRSPLFSSPANISQLPPPPSLTPILTAPPLPPPPTPTVQVAIGRIEIRATRPATSTLTPQARQTVQQRPTVSLDQYLQQQNRRS